MSKKPKQTPLDKLSRREREIVNALFAAGNRASAEVIRARLTNPPSSSAVRAMLTRLEAKGVLRHEEENLRYVYSATTSPLAARRALLEQYLRVFYGGSKEELMTTLLTQESWTREELDALQAKIDRVRKEGSR
jgi:BlaI family transcriptional regulator, penicillinase repressor